MKRIGNLLLGTDVEFFLQDKNTGEIVSAEGYVKGTKHKPFRFDPENPHFGMSLDNVLAEVCVPPTNNIEDWKGFLTKAIKATNDVLPDHLCTVALPEAELDEKFLKTKNARLIGCDVSYVVWKRSAAEKPDISKLTRRTSGFHVHFGMDNPEQTTCEDIIKTFDLLVGVPSTLIEPDNNRRDLYGEAGEFRFKPYGCEARILSGWWAGSEELMEWVFKGAQKVVDFVNNQDMEIVESHKDLILEAINGKNKQVAERLVREFEIELL